MCLPRGPQSPRSQRRKLPLSGAACDQLLDLGGATVADCTRSGLHVPTWADEITFQNNQGPGTDLVFVGPG